MSSTVHFVQHIWTVHFVIFMLDAENVIFQKQPPEVFHKKATEKPHKTLAKRLENTSRRCLVLGHSPHVELILWMNVFDISLIKESYWYLGILFFNCFWF